MNPSVATSITDIKDAIYHKYQEVTAQQVEFSNFLSIVEQHLHSAEEKLNEERNQFEQEKLEFEKQKSELQEQKKELDAAKERIHKTIKVI
jgi:chromosome segregation ATPase